jgi:hypothetical protein
MSRLPYHFKYIHEALEKSAYKLTQKSRNILEALRGSYFIFSVPLVKGRHSGTHRSTHIFGELLATENVEMEMLYALASVVSAVRDKTIALFKSLCRRDLRDALEDMRNVLAVLCSYLVKASDMHLGDNENMSGSLGVDITEREAHIVLVYLTRGDSTLNYFTE